MRRYHGLSGPGVGVSPVRCGGSPWWAVAVVVRLGRVACWVLQRVWVAAPLLFDVDAHAPPNNASHRGAPRSFREEWWAAQARHGGSGGACRGTAAAACRGSGDSRRAGLRSVRRVRAPRLGPQSAGATNSQMFGRSSAFRTPRGCPRTPRGGFPPAQPCFYDTVDARHTAGRRRLSNTAAARTARPRERRHPPLSPSSSAAGGPPRPCRPPQTGPPAPRRAPYPASPRTWPAAARRAPCRRSTPPRRPPH